MAIRFADAGFWIALWNRRDYLHRRAQQFANASAANPTVTTLPVLFEAVDHFTRMDTWDRRFASQSARNLLSDADIEIVPMSERLYRDALTRYAARLDKSWSLTDCSSFVLMEERGITEALAYDRDFEQAGFVALLRDESR